jgi:GMP synthase-like glutamine amidotransferase
MFVIHIYFYLIYNPHNPLSQKPAKYKYQPKLLWFVARVAIIENSPGLGGYFTKFLEGIEFEIFPVWDAPSLPKDEFDAYIFTGDFNNISDGLLPIHEAEVDFVKSIRNKKIFASCFFHQLIGKIHRGEVVKRETRFFGWKEMVLEKEHQIFNGLKEPYFLNLNVDELITKPVNAEVLATNPDCKFQVLLYNDNILTCQSHPEILNQEGLASIAEHRKALLVNCPNLDEMLEQTRGLADDSACKIFMENVVNWLVS